MKNECLNVYLQKFNIHPSMCTERDSAIKFKIVNWLTVNINATVQSLISHDSIPSHTLVSSSLTSVSCPYNINNYCLSPEPFQTLSRLFEVIDYQFHCMIMLLLFLHCTILSNFKFLDIMRESSNTHNEQWVEHMLPYLWWHCSMSYICIPVH